jgi:hypothetical protein
MITFGWWNLISDFTIPLEPEVRSFDEFIEVPELLLFIVISGDDKRVISFPFHCDFALLLELEVIFFDQFI